jgi:uncharacterized Fe-S center protein
MKEKVYLIKMSDNEDDLELCKKLEFFLKKEKFLEFISAKDMVAVKTHFGEKGSKGFIRPVYLNMLAKILKNKNSLPFLTETQTLYIGNRSNAVDHINHAYNHGFNPTNTRLPIIMADGLFGDEEMDVSIKGKIYDKVSIASLFAKVQAIIMLSHFTGHMVSGFGGALKNMGMGCASRKGKLIQHSTARPSIKTSTCTGCGLCIKWCPAQAITIINNIARIKNKICIGCGECLAVCRFNAVGYNWGETYENIQKKIVEHAMGLSAIAENRILYINFLNRITKDCDCLSGYDKIVPDIGILIAYDPVAIDAASLDLVEKTAGNKLSQIAHNIPYRIQIEYAREIGFMNPDYELIELTDKVY